MNIAKRRKLTGAEAFVAKMGAEAVREALARVDLAKGTEQLQQAMTETKAKQIRKNGRSGLNCCKVSRRPRAA